MKWKRELDAKFAYLCETNEAITRMATDPRVEEFLSFLDDYYPEWTSGGVRDGYTRVWNVKDFSGMEAFILALTHTLNGMGWPCLEFLFHEDRPLINIRTEGELSSTPVSEWREAVVDYSTTQVRYQITHLIMANSPFPYFARLFYDTRAFTPEMMEELLGGSCP